MALTDWLAGPGTGGTDIEGGGGGADIEGGGGGAGTTGEPTGVPWALLMLSPSICSMGLVSMSSNSGCGSICEVKALGVDICLLNRGRRRGVGVKEGFIYRS